MEAAYLRDIQRIALQRPITSIFFGGGTPSLMSERLVDRLINALNKRFGFAKDIEISIEANPDALLKPKMQAFQQSGINRLSIGVQALTEDGLKFLGRRHSLKKALLCIQDAHSIFKNLSIDLIYARPHQTRKQWDTELEMALSFHLPHYSLYQLTIEEGTPFYRKGIEPPDEEACRGLFMQTLEKMDKAGIPLYEVSNFAKPGFECRHNLIYWQGNDYAGIGPAAHGRLGLTATEKPADVEAWLQGKQEQTQLSQEERFEEKLLMGLRLRQGMSKAGIEPNKIQQAVQKGWLIEEKHLIRPTIEGLLMLNQLIVLLA